MNIAVSTISDKDLANQILSKYTIPEIADLILELSNYEVDSIVRYLLSRIDVYKLDAYNYKRHEYIYDNLYHGLKTLQVIIYVIIYVIFCSSNSANELETRALVALVFIPCFGILHVFIMLNMPNRISKYHDSSIVLLDIIRGIKIELRKPRDLNKLKSLKILLEIDERVRYVPTLHAFIKVSVIPSSVTLTPNVFIPEF